ncbi:glutamine-hydrolyzing carbamoyl-phosphate synthase small subunit, partial [bacterium]|nr:glutamine-hydrolyzing carbamoyl-phosphate synthase small subunit [bacterium]
PSYAGQIITFTFPHIGNVGTNGEDIEAKEPLASGLILRDPITPPDNYRAVDDFNQWLVTNGLTGISRIDTRRLTRRIRLKGAPNGVIAFRKGGFDDATIEKLKDKAKKHPSLNGMELAKDASTTAPLDWTETRWAWNHGYRRQEKPKYHIVAIDYGAKMNILRHFAERACKVTVVPADYPAEKILALKPDGVFLSNGPGDPAATGEYALPIIKKLLESGIPIFGICLGHQLLGLALGGKTEKMKQGHRGANHPIQQLDSGRVEITAQNHGFVVNPDSLPKGVKVTHKSLFDGTCAGLEVTGKPVFAVQYHPEASPGPHDSGYLFDKFVQMVSAHTKTGKKNHE